MSLPVDYAQRVYAGVLGKLIGVYLGRPFEGWSHAKILADLGEINYYVHEKRGVPLIVTDDDISGTFTFIRALEDHGTSRWITAGQIGQTWLNYIIEGRTILWWGGLGVSTEHTAYLRLKHGIEAPRSGAMATNSQVVAEQIGSQIFVDGWAMVAPGDPALAAELARQAASVSHDGEAIYGAQVVAAIESQAFVERDIGKLLDTAVCLIPRDCVIARMITDLRHEREKHDDWRKAFGDVMQARYGYDKFGGGCHMVPNHGVIMLALLWGDDDFQKSLMIANTCGWDTDCNSGNVGCIMGIKNGLSGPGSLGVGPDWRGPVADRLYLPTADGGSCVTDAVTQTYRLVNLGRALGGEPVLSPKHGARFHFSLPGLVQGFMPEDSAEVRGTTRIANELSGTSDGESGERCLAIHYEGLAADRVSRVATATFVPPDAVKAGGYAMAASPTLYSGQTITAKLSAAATNGQPVTARLYVRPYDAHDALAFAFGPEATWSPGHTQELTWRLPNMRGQPVAQVGVEISGVNGAAGTAYLHALTWSGEPEVIFHRTPGSMARRAWVDAMSHFLERGEADFRFAQNEGRGLLIQGARDWRDYSVAATIRPHMVRAVGLAARVQGLRRYYALFLLPGNRARLVKVYDDQETTLGETSLAWELTKPYALQLEVRDNRIVALVDGRRIVDAVDDDRPLTSGGIALVCEEGSASAGAVSVAPLRA
ncbi:MAG: ADP-ribosylglycohydrolase family protein [Phycisphaeraceae bacterium]